MAEKDRICFALKKAGREVLENSKNKENTGAFMIVTNRTFRLGLIIALCGY
jgi:hypothetical protein